MWVKLWAGVDEDHDSEAVYHWLRDDHTDETLRDYAEDHMDSIAWLRGADRVRWGFERLEVLPDKVRQELIARYEAEIRNAKGMIALLQGGLPPVREIPETKSRFERDIDFKI